jgi:hypothetical protein
MIGKNLIKGIEDLNQIIIYKILSSAKFEICSSHTFEEKYRRFCKSFVFDTDIKDDPSILLLSNEVIVRFKFKSNSKPDITTIYTFNSEKQIHD